MAKVTHLNFLTKLHLNCILEITGKYYCLITNGILGDALGYFLMDFSLVMVHNN